jgi:hypothetical protein
MNEEVFGGGVYGIPHGGFRFGRIALTYPNPSNLRPGTPILRLQLVGTLKRGKCFIISPKREQRQPEVVLAFRDIRGAAK